MAKYIEELSQSLLHQVTYSDKFLIWVIVLAVMSQSLLHQVTYSDRGVNNFGG